MPFHYTRVASSQICRQVPVVQDWVSMCLEGGHVLMGYANTFSKVVVGSKVAMIGVMAQNTTRRTLHAPTANHHVLLLHILRRGLRLLLGIALCFRTSTQNALMQLWRICTMSRLTLYSNTCLEITHPAKWAQPNLRMRSQVKC